MATVLHIVGEILVGPADTRPECWVLDGRVTYAAPTGPGHDVQTVRGWALPGLVDAHCHVGLDHHGPVEPDVAEQQATADRDAGTLLIRDSGSPADTRWIDDRDDLPRIVRAGKHIARTRRYIRNYAHEIEPDELVAHVRMEARRGDGWVKLVGDWIDRETGDLAPCWP
ncbi:MAG TPA: amidohydrolase, partial [Dermatophilaceae bacterium]|nr:amidohydrolase [Dermatophilaceae bacterium]